MHVPAHLHLRVLWAGSEINFFGYSPVGRVAIKLYSPDTKIYSPNVNSKQQDKQALATIINDRT